MLQRVWLCLVSLLTYDLPSVFLTVLRLDLRPLRLRRNVSNPCENIVTSIRHFLR